MALDLRRDSGEKCEHHRIKQFRSLQWSEVTHAGQKDEFRIGNAVSEIFGVFALDEFIVFAMHYGDRHMDLGEIVG